MDWEQFAEERKSRIEGQRAVHPIQGTIDGGWILVVNELPPFSHCEVSVDPLDNQSEGIIEESDPVLVRLKEPREIETFGPFRVLTYRRTTVGLDYEGVFYDPDDFHLEADFAWYARWRDAAEEYYDSRYWHEPEAWIPLPKLIGRSPHNSCPPERGVPRDLGSVELMTRKIIEDNHLLQIPHGLPRRSKTRTIEAEGVTVRVRLSSDELPSRSEIEWLRELAATESEFVPEGILLEQELAKGGNRDSLRSRIRRCCVHISVHSEGSASKTEYVDQLFAAWRIRNPRDPEDPECWSTASIWTIDTPWDDRPKLSGIWLNKSLVDQFLSHQNESTSAHSET